MSLRKTLLCCAALCALASCQKPTTYAPTVTPQELQAEQAHQQQLVEQAALQGGVRKNWQSNPKLRKQFEPTAARIEKAGVQLCQEMGLPQMGRGCFYNFAVKNQKDLNAYADGENVVVFSGMINFLQNETELAAVLAHELAHNYMAHPSSTQTNATIGALAGMAADALAASQGYDMGGQMTQMGGQMGVLRYSAPFELEADYVSLYILARAGYDITKAPDLWRRMSLQNPDGIYNSYTHPTNAERFVALQKTINEIRSKRRLGMPLLPERHQPA